MRKATADRVRGPHLDSEVPGLVRGLSASTASIFSLHHIPGVHLGARIVVAILGLDEVPTVSPPPLPGGLQGVTVVVTRFTGNSGQEATWRAVFAHAGAREAIVLTPSTSDELPVVVESVLNGRGQPLNHEQRGGC
jgi:hypothetical protein